MRGFIIIVVLAILTTAFATQADPIRELLLQKAALTKTSLNGE
jgi:hypothetical protein